MQKVGTAIKQRKDSFNERIQMVNTYLIPCIGYLIFFLFEADFIQLVVLNLSHLNYIKLCLFLTSNKR